MNWHEYLLNPKVMLGYYDKAPSLQCVEVHRVSLLRDGPVAEIVFDVHEFPARPSAKWPVSANTCQITLRALGLMTVELAGWGTGVWGELAIMPVAGGLAVIFAGEGKFRFVCTHLEVSGVSGYVNEGRCSQ